MKAGLTRAGVALSLGGSQSSAAMERMFGLSVRDRAQALWDEMAQAVPPYPRGVVPVPEPIKGTAFFPGGLGLCVEESSVVGPEHTPVMVVGQDFNTAATYERARQCGTEIDSSQTWWNIRSVFRKLGLPIEQCFFTNFYMGLREGGSEVGPFPGRHDRGFVQRCARFFERELEVMRPKLIVTLGTVPMVAVGKEVFKRSMPRTLSECVDVYEDLPAAYGSVALVGLTHPSLYFANVGRRRFRGLKGLDAERAMVQAATGKIEGWLPAVDHSIAPA